MEKKTITSGPITVELQKGKNMPGAHVENQKRNHSVILKGIREPD